MKSFSFNPLFHSKRRRVFLQGVFFIALLALLVLSWKRYQQWHFQVKPEFVQSQERETIPEVEILSTDKGFIPARIEVNVGTRLVFQTNGTTTFATASDPHPAHTDNPGFNMGATDTAFPTRMLTLSTTGSFGFHDELHPEHRGFVRVVDPKHPTREIDKTPSSQIAIRDHLLTLFDPNNVDSIFLMIDTIQSDPQLSRNCHDVAHD